MRRFVSLAVALLLSLPTLLGCELPDSRAEVRFEIPRERFYDFLSLPWPEDTLRTADGLDLSAFPNPYETGLLDDYVGLFASAPGYASSGALYFAVDGGVDEASLPATPRDSIQRDSTMFLIELARPHQRLPIEWKTYPEGTSFLPPGSVAVLPLVGAIVRGPAALVVTADARALDGRRLGPSSDLLALLGCRPLEGVERMPDCAPYQRLASDIGLAPDAIALVQKFTPAVATDELLRAYEQLVAAPPPAVLDLTAAANEPSPLYALFTGTVELAQFQQGSPPHNDFDGASGGFLIDGAGVPVVQRTEDVQFALTVPLGEEPESGWPIVVYGHGTGGSLFTGVGHGPSSEAYQLARAGCAMLSISEPLQEGRAGYTEAGVGLNTFNFLNPMAGRDYWRKSTLEKVQLISVARNLAIPATVAGRAVRFDPEQVHYFGHSQGGIVGAILLGVEQRIGGAFLSGAGGGFASSIIEKTEPVDLSEVLRSLVGLPDEEPVDRFHLIPNLMQIWVEPLEPLNYAALWRERVEGHRPHVVMSSGLMDLDTPPRTHAGLATVFGLQTVEPVALHLDVAELQGITPVPGPAVGNQQGIAGEPLTAGLLQYPDDGHFAVFYNPDAQEAYRLFFETIQSGAPTARVR